MQKKNPDLFSNTELLTLEGLEEEIAQFASEYKSNKISNEAVLDMIRNGRDINSFEKWLDKYSSASSDVWKRYVKRPDAGEKSISYLVHAGLISNGKYRKNVISTSLISSQHLITAANRTSGMIIVPNDIIGAESFDQGVNNFSQTDKELSIGGGRQIIKLPQVVEHESMQRREYSEINSRNFEIAGVYSIIEENEKPKDYLIARKLAQKLKLPFVEIDEVTKQQQIFMPKEREYLLKEIIEKGKKFVRSGRMIELYMKIETILSKQKKRDTEKNQDESKYLV